MKMAKMFVLVVKSQILTILESIVAQAKNFPANKAFQMVQTLLKTRGLAILSLPSNEAFK